MHLDKFDKDVANIEIIYEELNKFISTNTDAKVLAKIHDISQFISKSIDDLEKIAKVKGFDKQSNFVSKELKPLTLNVSKAYEIISKFNMVAQKPLSKDEQQTKDLSESQQQKPFLRGFDDQS